MNEPGNRKRDKKENQEARKYRDKEEIVNQEIGKRFAT